MESASARSVVSSKERRGWKRLGSNAAVGMVVKRDEVGGMALGACAGALVVVGAVAPPLLAGAGVATGAGVAGVTLTGTGGFSLRSALRPRPRRRDLGLALLAGLLALIAVLPYKNLTY